MRKYDIDVLKVILFGLLILYYMSRFFAARDNYLIQNLDIFVVDLPDAFPQRMMCVVAFCYFWIHLLFGMKRKMNVLKYNE